MIFTLLSAAASALDRLRQSRADSRSVEDILAKFRINNDLLRRMMQEMDEAMTAGLRYGTDGSNIAMLPSFIPELPDGTETGKYLAMDLGGTNLRVLLLDFDKKKANGQPTLLSRNYKITSQAMTGTSDMLFDFIVEHLAQFLEEKELLDADLALGFTFSYPCKQTSLTNSILMQWTKGFDVEGVEGNDVVKLLSDAIKRLGGIKVRVVAILNDTVGTMVSTAYEYAGCDLAAIIATGTNCAYMEDSTNIRKLEDDGYVNEYPHMIINTEWGAFADGDQANYIKTEYDRIVDAASTHPGKYMFDKLVAGMYMGELVRLVLERLVKNKHLFSGEGSKFLFTPGKFPTKYISEILSDDAGYLHDTKQILDELDIKHYTYTDLLLLREACIVVSRRSAYLAAAAIACVINRMHRTTTPRELVVGIDGSTYKYHPFFHSWVKERVFQLIDPEIRMRIVLAGDGSGKGAALCAAIAEKLAKRKTYHDMVSHEPPDKMVNGV